MTGPGGVIGLGIDVTAVSRWRSMLAREPGVLDVAFSEEERRWAGGIPARAALLWAAKEATVKAFGFGFGPVEWPDIVADLSSDPPRLRIPTRRLEDLGIRPHRVVVRAGFAPRTPLAAVALALHMECGRADRGADGSAAEVAVALERVPAEGSRTARRSAERRAAARAARRGLEALGERRAYVLTRSADGRPLLRLPGSDAPSDAPSDAAEEPPLVSLAHCSGWAAAALCSGARPEGAGRRGAA
jgi:phosphopantetheinyl transferase (holo-ACP synthase)